MVDSAAPSSPVWNTAVKLFFDHNCQQKWNPCTVTFFKLLTPTFISKKHLLMIRSNYIILNRFYTHHISLSHNYLLQCFPQSPLYLFCLLPNSALNVTFYCIVLQLITIDLVHILIKYLGSVLTTQTLSSKL